MQLEITERPAMRVGGIRHVGPYHKIASAYEKLGGIAGRAGLFGMPGVQMLGVYHDLPDNKPEEELTSDAAVSLPEDFATPDGLAEQLIPGGRYAHATHNGDYSTLGNTWKAVMDAVAERGLRVARTPCYEIYVNNPSNTPPDELRTEIYVPVA